MDTVRNKTRFSLHRRLGPAAVATLALGASQILAAGQTPASQAEAGRVERMDPALDRLIGSEAVVERVASGFMFVEGPVWVPASADPTGPYLLFSDIPANKVYRFRPDDSGGGTTDVFLEPVLQPDARTGGNGGSNGLALDPQGRVVLCEHGNRRVARLEKDGTRTTLANRLGGKRLNSPNDIVFHTNGSAYFTDPPYGLSGQDDDPRKELAWNGIYRLHESGRVEILEKGQERPNGIGLSPDQATLYVADSSPKRIWMAYPVKPNGRLGKGRVFHDASGAAEPGVPDGLTLDERGNVYGTGPGGVWVLDPAGRHLGTIHLAELPANVGWGDDGKSLYMTARTGLYRLRMEVSGLRLP